MPFSEKDQEKADYVNRRSSRPSAVISLTCQVLSVRRLEALTFTKFTKRVYVLGDLHTLLNISVLSNRVKPESHY